MAGYQAEQQAMGSVGGQGHHDNDRGEVAPGRRTLVGAELHHAAARGAATPGGALPHAEAIQRSFGRHDISSIRAHTGGEATAAAHDIGAEAYASGRDVVLGGSTDLFTAAHEAAHVVQQRGGVQLKGGVGEEGDAYEQHANEVASLVVQGQSAEALLDRHAGGGSTGADAPAQAGAVQRTQLADRAAERAPQKVELSQSFERRLGVAAYRDARALQAADDVLRALLRATIPGFDPTNPAANSDADKARVGEVFGRDENRGAGSAGQVGNGFDEVWEAMTQGNLRERMTAIYNASLGDFKAEVKRLMDEGNWDEIGNRGMDTAKLRRRKNQMPKWRGGTGDLYRQPGNPIDRKHMSMTLYGTTRHVNDPAQQQSQRTVGELEADGIGLSDREERFMFREQHEEGFASLYGIDPDERVSWKEGGTIFRPNENNSWVRKIQTKLLMPVTAGPSGTALRLFQAWEWLNKPADAASFRLALLGYMLTGNDHSFHEIMLTSSEYGLPYTPGVDAYRNVAPYTEAELKAIAGVEGFPRDAHFLHDHGVKASEELGAGPWPPPVAPDAQNSVLATPRQIEAARDVLDSATHTWRVRPADAEQLAQLLALITYTDDYTEHEPDHGPRAFRLMNQLAKNPHNWFTLAYLLKTDRLLWEKAKRRDFGWSELLADVRTNVKYLHAAMDLLPLAVGPLHRGYSQKNPPRIGDEWSEGKFTSMSHDPARATHFMNQGSRPTKVFATLAAPTTGRDLGEASVFGPDEAEVLFVPGTRFRITAVTPAAGHYEVQWIQV